MLKETETEKQGFFATFLSLVAFRLATPGYWRAKLQNNIRYF